MEQLTKILDNGFSKEFKDMTYNELLNALYTIEKNIEEHECYCNDCGTNYEPCLEGLRENLSDVKIEIELRG